MLGNRHSQHSFAQIPDTTKARSQFNRSCAVKDTMYFDALNPIFVDEVVPGDVINLNVNSFARLATQKVPVMDNLYMDFFFFFVPCRLVWDNWEKFCGAQDAPGDSTDYTVPKLAEFTADAPGNGTIFDHFGLPTNVTEPWQLENVLPLRAYNLIYNEWFRDENLKDPVEVHTDDGPDPLASYGLVKRGKRHDYFTSCLPWPQKGPSVDLPLGTSAPVVGLGIMNPNTAVLRTDVRETQGLVNPRTGWAIVDSAPGSGQTNAFIKQGNVGYPDVYADLTDASAATINQLREAFAMQSLFELDARGGTRYVEILRSHYGVISPDFRLQRPEYLGGGSTNFNMHPVAQTAPPDGDDVPASLAAFATASTRGGAVGFTKSFVEHGYIIGLCSARADITYQQGLNRLWSRRTRYDFYWPKLAELGEQAVLRKEIYLTGNPTNDDAVFGYQERFAEYRYKPSEIRGEFRSNYDQSLDMWHMAQEFGSAPQLNGTFIDSNTPIARSIAVSESPPILFDAFFQVTHARPMPMYSVPATLGRF